MDGSNLATEGRSAPSLKQLDEAVRAYATEDPGADIIVVVDATFEHRVSDAERDEVRNAMLNGEVISPPAGAIGRGDAFVLRIAERTGATVLSNDSFQEFHGEHPWLFDDNRLIGGKPVPGVGWIFTPRVPIRGPKSRAATAEAKARGDHASAPAKAAELARAAKKAAKRGGKSKKASTKATKAAVSTVDSSWPIKPQKPPPGRAKVDPVVSSAIEEAVEEALHPPTPEKPRGTSKKQATAKKAPAQKNAKTKRETQAGKAKPQASAKRDQSDANKRKKRSVPPPAVNEPLAFINFVAAFSVGSTIDGEVVSFTSHGAMVDVPLPGSGVLHCYIPLTAMGTPPPTKARKVLKKGEVRSFVLAGLDPPRRVAELALPSEAQAKKKGTDASARPTSAPAKKAAKKQTPTPQPAQTRTEKKPAPAKKATPKRGLQATKQAAAKKPAVKKSTTKKAAAKKTTAKKSAKKAPSKRAKPPTSAAPVKKASKVTRAAKTPAAKTSAAKATAAKAPAKKPAKKPAPAKKAPTKRTSRTRA